mgnify:CR=1 FL=1
MNILAQQLISEYCREQGFYIEKIVYEQLSQQEKNRYDNGRPFLFGYSSTFQKREEFTSGISAPSNVIYIFTYAELPLKEGDIIRIRGRGDFIIEQITETITRKKTASAKRYSLMLK